MHWCYSPDISRLERRKTLAFPNRCPPSMCRLGNWLIGFRNHCTVMLSSLRPEFGHWKCFVELLKCDGTENRGLPAVFSDLTAVYTIDIPLRTIRSVGTLCTRCPDNSGASWIVSVRNFGVKSKCRCYIRTGVEIVASPPGVKIVSIVSTALK